MHTYKSLMAVCAAALLGLAACGGGGGGPSGQDPKPQTVSLTGVTAGYTMLTAVSQKKIEAGKSFTQNDVTFDCAANGKDCVLTITVGTDGMATVTATGGMVTAKNSAAYVQKIQDAKKKRIAAAEVLNAAIEVAASDSPAATFNPDDNDNTGVSGGMVSDGATPNGFTKSDSDMPPSIDHWKGSVWTKETTAGTPSVKTTQTVVVYTNIEDPKKAAYNDYYPDGNTQTPSGYVAWRGVTEANNFDVDPGSGEDLRRRLKLSGTVDDDSRPLISFAHGITGPHQRIPVRDDNDTDVDEREFAGTFHGISGTFACTSSSGCTINSDEKGMLSGFTGDWVFTPDKLASGADPYEVAGVLLDADYLDFGYWVRDIDGTNASKVVDAFFDAPADAADISTGVTGSATYSGPAAGLYAKRVYKDDGTIGDRSSGRFTASASLSATFAQLPDNTIPPNQVNSISGTITGFMDAMGMPIDRSWSVTLGKIWAQDNNNNTSWGNSFFGVVTVTDDGPTVGKWNGSFYGVDPKDNNKPTHVGGEFTARFSNGDVIGAFGTTKD